ncbi:RidA family protein [Flavobacteriaceae bacterium MHTCC 0001]
MKTIINTKNAPEPLGPYNQAVLSNDTLYLSGQIAINPETGVLVSDTIKSETHQVMKNLEAVLNAANFAFSHVVKASIFISNMDNFAVINEVYGSYFDDATAPARETVEVSKLPKNVNVEISMIAVK